jgi:hypothetical protein
LPGATGFVFFFSDSSSSGNMLGPQFSSLRGALATKQSIFLYAVRWIASLRSQ